MFDFSYLFQPVSHSPALYVVESNENQHRTMGTVHRTAKNEYVATISEYKGKRVRPVSESKPMTTLESAIFWLSAHKELRNGVVVA
jgi:hypothetical protein